MGVCKYCGKDAGWFSHSHRECEEKNLRGKEELSSAVNSYFKLKIQASELQQIRIRLTKDAFLSADDIVEIAEPEIHNYTASIRRPFSPASMRLMDDFLNVIGVTYGQMNQNGAVNEFTKKLMKGFMVEFFTDQLTLPVAHSRCEKVLKHFPMAQSDIEDAYYYVLNKAAANFLRNGNISDAEQQKIEDYMHYLSLPLNNIPAPYQNGDISKLGQALVLKDVMQGVVPQNTITAPILLGKNESVLWTYNEVNLYQEEITKEYVGETGGFDFRLTKNITYKTNRMQGRPIEHHTMELKGTGALYVTNQHLVFQSHAKGIKIPFSKIIGLTPYADGIEVHKDGTDQRRMIFEGFDSWFLMNLITQINNL